MKEKSRGKVEPQKNWPDPPNLFKRVIKTYAASKVWPDVPDEVKRNYKFYHILRDWLCEIVPKGELREYCKIELVHSDDNEFDIVGVRAILYSHTFRYVIIVNDKKLFIKALKRKPLAGTEGGEEAYEGDDLVDCGFTIANWEHAKNLMLRYEFVKVLKSSRTEEIWISLSSHYRRGSKEGKQCYAEWEQKGDEIRNHKVYELVGESS